MSNRKGLIGAAACAALALTGLARANEAATPVAPDYTKSVTLDNVPAGANAPKYDALMSLLVKTGPGKALADAGIVIGGRVEGSLTYSMSAPPGNFIAGRVFDFENQDITLNQAALYVNKDVDGSKFDIGGRMEWIYGGDSRLIHSLGLFDYYNSKATPDDEQWDLNQLYVDIGIGGGMKVRVGKMITPVGYEVIDPTGNQLYSHSFLFGYAIPFTHTGAFFYHTVNDSFSYMVGFSRGWDTSLEDNNGSALDFVGSATWQLDPKTKFIINVTAGPEQAGDSGNWRTLLDVQYIQQIGDNLTIALNGDYAYEPNSQGSAEGSDAQWWGLAAYASLVIDSHMTLNGRVEYFNDQDGARLTGAVGGTSLYEATIGLAITPFPTSAYGRGLIIRPEVRFDYGERAFFDGGTDHYQFTAAVDAIYKF